MSFFYDECRNEARLSVIAGPCIFESKEHALDMAGSLKEICASLDVNFIYKTSFDKANRTSSLSYRGVGFDEAYYGMNAVREVLGVEVLTDVHEAWQCGSVAADILQIPAFLCRQTDLLKAAAETGKPVNVKKGQFLSPKEMVNIVAMLESFGCI
jgi:2-dehydro-3-deoxyphosphooctonate aldolase (KDO 8-P synthase)